MNTQALIDRIGEIALKHCADYPDIKAKAPFEQLYAIESTLAGIEAANRDCHAIIRILGKRCGMTPAEVADLWCREIPLT